MQGLDVFPLTRRKALGTRESLGPGNALAEALLAAQVQGWQWVSHCGDSRESHGMGFVSPAIPCSGSVCLAVNSKQSVLQLVAHFGAA